MFTTREAAIAVWVCLAVAWALTKSNLRASVHSLLKSAFRWKIVLPLVLMAAYTAAVVGLLYAVGAWEVSLLKDTILWFVLSGPTLVYLVVVQANEAGIWRRALVDQLTIVVILEYIMNTYTFSFPVEMGLVPVLTVVAMLDAQARSDTEHALVARFTRGLQAFLGFGVLVVATVRAMQNVSPVHAGDSIRAVLWTPLLAILNVPFFYVLALMAAYELLLIRLKLGPPKDPEFLRHARRSLVRHLGLRLRKVGAFTHAHAWDLAHVKTRADLEELLRKDDAVSKQEAAGIS